MKRKILRVVPSAGARIAALVALLLAAPPSKGADPVSAATPVPSSPSKKSSSSVLSSDLARIAEVAVKDGRTAGSPWSRL